jgi:predicted phosphodiesterase
MMLIRMMSDIHNEFCRAESGGDYFVPELADDKESLLILAGDIGLLNRKQTWLDFVSKCSDQF